MNGAVFVAKDIDGSMRARHEWTVTRFHGSVVDRIANAVYVVLRHDTRLNDECIVELEDQGRVVASTDETFDGICRRFALRAPGVCDPGAYTGRLKVYSCGWLEACEAAGRLINPDSAVGRQWQIKVRFRSDKGIEAPPGSPTAPVFAPPSPPARRVRRNARVLSPPADWLVRTAIDRMRDSMPTVVLGRGRASSPINLRSPSPEPVGLPLAPNVSTSEPRELLVGEDIDYFLEDPIVGYEAYKAVTSSAAYEESVALRNSTLPPHLPRPFFRLAPEPKSARPRSRSPSAGPSTKKAKPSE